jgi:hypothetical protein
MGMLPWNVQWLNQNSQRSYPLTDWATKQDITGTITLPTSFIVALYLPVHAGLAVEPHLFYVQSLGIYPTGYNIGIGYNDGSSSPPLVASVNIARSTHTENRTYALAGVDDFDDSVGRIAIGDLSEIDRLPPGQYTFSYAGGGLETDAIWPMIRGISSFTTVNGLERSEQIYGHVELVAYRNMRITASQVGTAAPKITFSAIEGEGLNEDCICEEEVVGPAIRTINGVEPNDSGNLRIVGDNCFVITPIENGIRIEDTCSQPCCGCEALQAVISQIDRFADGVVTFQNFANTLGSEVTQFHQVILGSRLSDQGCIEC